MRVMATVSLDRRLKVALELAGEEEASVHQDCVCDARPAPDEDFVHVIRVFVVKFVTEHQEYDDDHFQA